MAVPVVEELPPFSVPGTVGCRMCGGIDIHMEYLATGSCLHGTNYRLDSDQPNPRMHRTCSRCGHEWDERTLNDSPQEVKEAVRLRYGLKAPKYVSP